MCIFLIHLSFDGHLGCFHLSTVVNNATVNMNVKLMPFEIRLDFQKTLGLILYMQPHKKKCHHAITPCVHLAFWFTQELP